MRDAARVAGWELGNEPNCYNKTFRIPISGADVAANFKALSRTLAARGAGRFLLAGPDAEIVGDPQTSNQTLNGRCGPHMSAGDFFSWMEAFLAAAPPDLAAVTWHYYPQSHRWPDSGPAQMLTPAFMDRMRQYSDRMAALRDKYLPSAQLWLGETAAYWGGGLPGATNAFVDVIFTADQAGTLATTGHQGMFRQTLVGGGYALIESPALAGDVGGGHGAGGEGAAAAFTPNPSYYLAVLWHRVLGDCANVVDVSGGPAGGSPAPVRAYAFCAPAGASATRSMVLINPSSQPAAVDLAPSASGVRLEWHLTSGDGTLTSRGVRLNGGAPLAPDAKGDIGPLPPVAASAAGPLRIEPYSVVLVQLP
mmetsp:Transcript_3789/g.14051  ORF Transcript_3789/g.14051 Transcript_3789/m.14051 type:complete len:365 (-) Transcript_3789:1729-2823(-)